MAEIKRLIDEKTFGELQKMKGRLPVGEKDKQAAKTKTRPVREKESERGSRLDGQATRTTKRRRRRRRGRNENQAKRKEQ